MNEKLRQQVAQRAQHCCEYCFSQANYSPDPFSIEHIIPLVKGGLTISLNLALSCQGCNNRKYIFTSNFDPITGQFADFYNPRKDVWREHFRWNQNFSKIVGISPTGRVTVERLQLNRQEVVNLRVVLAAIGQHPPFEF